MIRMLGWEYEEQEMEIRKRCSNLEKPECCVTVSYLR